MKERTVIYIGNDEVQVVFGKKNKETLEVTRYETIPLVEGSMLNGLIIDEQNIKNVIDQVAKFGVEEAELIINSGQIRFKQLTIPKMKEKEIFRFISLELIEEDESAEDIVCDYSFVKEGLEKGESKIIAAAISKKLVEQFKHIFSSCGIELVGMGFTIDVLISLLKEIRHSSNKTYLIMQVDRNYLSAAIFVNNEYLLSNQFRFLSKPDEEGYEKEFLNYISNLKQFVSSSDKNQRIDCVYCFGLENGEKLYEASKKHLNVFVKDIPNLNKVIIKEEKALEKFKLSNYLYSVGYLLGKD